MPIEGREPDALCGLPSFAGVCSQEVGPLQVRRAEEHLPEMSRALLQARYEGADAGGDALRRSANDALSSVGGTSALVAGTLIVTRFSGKQSQNYWKYSIFAEIYI